MAMLTNNLFADFLINDNRETVYSMLDFDNCDAYIAFFSGAVSVQVGDQFSIAEIKAPLFGYNHIYDGSVLKTLAANMANLLR